LAGDGARAVRGGGRRVGGQAAGDRGEGGVVGLAVAVVVAAVAHLHRGDADAAHAAIVDHAVTVVVLAVAGLGDGTVGRRAALELVLVGLAVAVVVDVVALLARVEAEPGRGHGLRGRVGAGQQGEVALGRRGGDRGLVQGEAAGP